MRQYLDYLGEDYLVDKVLFEKEGSSTILLAYDKLLKKQVAVKIVDQNKSKFTSNYQVIIDHPHLIKCHRIIDKSEHLKIYILDYCSEGNLRKVISSYPINSEFLSRVFSSIIEGLGYLHGKGIVHGDLKSENILFASTENGVILKLIDYNNYIRHQSGVADNSVAATPEYASPEQFAGRYFPASDFWSLGCIIYEIFTGKLPFGSRENGESDLEGIRAAVLTKAIPKNLIKIPYPYNYIIYKCLQKDLSKRFQTSQEILNVITKQHSTKLKFAALKNFISGIITRKIG